MQARFLLGPAGSGKTFRCLAEIRAALGRDPQGPPLIFLAPKQATFQLERQLLGDPALSGYTRLHILSFERLAGFILKQLRRPGPALLSEEGRVMVLRALLARRRGDLQIFHGSAGLAGFARQLSLELRELQRREFSPELLTELAARPDFTEPLRRKLRDLALLQRACLDWLAQQNLQDADCLPDLAAAALQSPPTTPSSTLHPPSSLSISALWLDGFGELTPQELSLLAALAPCCQRMTLAFCVEGERPPGADSWLSIWSAIAQTRQDCWQKLSAVPGVRLETEILPRHPSSSRFAENPVLRHLEENWAQPAPFPDHHSDAPARQALRAAICANLEGEAVLAAREILQFVHAGGRYRQTAVLLRTLEGVPRCFAARFFTLRHSVFPRSPRAFRPPSAGRADPQRPARDGLRLAARGLVQRPQNRPDLRRRRGH